MLHLPRQSNFAWQIKSVNINCLNYVWASLYQWKFDYLIFVAVLVIYPCVSCTAPIIPFKTYTTKKRTFHSHNSSEMLQVFKDLKGEFEAARAPGTVVVRGTGAQCRAGRCLHYAPRGTGCICTVCGQRGPWLSMVHPKWHSAPSCLEVNGPALQGVPKSKQEKQK